MKLPLASLLDRFRQEGGAAGLVQRTLSAHGLMPPPAPERPAAPPPRAKRRRPAAASAPSLPAALPRGLPASLAALLPGGAGAGAPEGMSRHVTATPQGSRVWWLHGPALPAAAPAIVVMLHGCTQTTADFARSTGMNAAAAARGWHVVWPEQAGEANAMRCWNWFEPAHQSAAGGEPAILAAIIEEARREIGAPAAPVFVAGLSAGGAMAAVLARARPDLVAAVGIHSGLPVGAASSMQGALAAMRGGPARGAAPLGVPAIVFHGDADRTVAPANGEALAAAIGGAETSGRTGRRYWTRRADASGEYWRVEGLGHAWSGGAPDVPYSDPDGPDATAEMLRFFAARL